MYENIREEELKNKIAQAYFPDFDSTQIIGNIDFAVTIKKEFQISETESVLWAEAKKGKADIFNSITQLILTVGKARTFDLTLPPAYLGAFDAEKIAFLPYNDIQEIFYLNDFNWNVTPSNYETKEFKMVLEKARAIIETNSLQFSYKTDELELREFIKINFVSGRFANQKIRIDKNNFISIYNKWLQTVKPTIAVIWEEAQKVNIIDGDFYLADLLSLENETLKEKLYVLLKTNRYELERTPNKLGMFSSQYTGFIDKQKAHQIFWNKYERPPREEYWDYIVERRDLLVPQDVRERKGSFYTPQIWVELSQKYLADVLGTDWQDEYYIWDCAAGTGNLLAGLTNKQNIWASTLDRQDIDVIKDRILNGANLLEKNVFQFDFLNDSFDKLPKGLQNVINDSEKRKKLIIYINPPYAEAGSVFVVGARKNKTDVSIKNNVWDKYKNQLGLAIRELFAQFFIRISQEIPNCKLASFSTLKYVNGDGFGHFRELFNPKYKAGFVVPANTFDNVNGAFPIGFLIWDFENKQDSKQIKTDIYDRYAKNVGKKNFYIHLGIKRITEWISKQHVKSKDNIIGYTGNNGPDFQNNNYCYLINTQKTNKNGVLNNATKYSITKDNLISICVYFAVRKCIELTWLNNGDQFLCPNEKWKKNKEFQNNCLVYSLFHGKNMVSSKHGTNHWIPFTEYEVGAQDDFDSNFMTDFIAGKIKDASLSLLPKKKPNLIKSLEFSEEAQAVFESGKKLWQYYHAQIKEVVFWGRQKANVNASLYDIREYFQGRNEKGKMHNKSTDEKYTQLISDLRKSLQVLAKKIEPKIYEYGFLKE
ncbi:MAG: hypothetical protein EAZ97_09390 [Bacteroidetes bacterium]|nr:MAG: hypothetical protein EAZ97_09390 [Bacteroidota bacterium]